MLEQGAFKYSKNKLEKKNSQKEVLLHQHLRASGFSKALEAKPGGMLGSDLPRRGC